jgi:general secretion pathway protein D
MAPNAAVNGTMGMTSDYRRHLLLAIAALLASCQPARLQVPPPRLAVPSAAVAGAPTEAVAAESDSTRKSGLDRLDAPPRTSTRLATQDWSGRFPANDRLTVAVQAMPLRDFVQYAFGELLKASYVLVPGIAGMDEPVTLNVQQPVSSRALYKLIDELLGSRKVTINFRDGVYYLAPAGDKGGGVRIGYGRRPQDVPDVTGRILQVVPLRYGMNISIERTVKDLANVQVQPDPLQGALFVSGERDAVLRVLDVVALLDQPGNRARQLGLLNLTYIGSKDLSDQLATLLENEGIPTGIGRADGKNVALVPLDQLGAVAVFASSAELLDRVEFWARQIDRPSQGPEQRYFIYYPKNARATDLGESLAPLVGGEMPSRTGSQARDTRSALSSPTTGMRDTESSSAGVSGETAMRRDRSPSTPGAGPVAVKGDGLTLSVDPRSNTLIFYTTGMRYQSLLPMIRRLDVPPKQILLEATIAEVSLTGEFAYGVEFAVTEGRWSGGTQGNLGLPGGGLTLNWIDSVGDSVRAKLSSKDTRVNVLSNPTLVVRDGVEAQIVVGNDVPTIGATASDPIQSNRTITTVLYRRTGLELTVRPTINAQGMVVMEITQSISNTVDGGSDVEGAPVIFQRAVTTEVVARTGQTVLLAGLISSRNNDTRNGVPGLSKIPVLGALFESRTRSREKTELVVLITPRIIENPEEWDNIRAGLQDAMQLLQIPAPPVASGSGSGAGPGPAGALQEEPKHDDDAGGTQ